MPARCAAPSTRPPTSSTPTRRFPGAKPELRSSDHFFFRLSDPRCIAFLKEWLDAPGRLQPQVVNKAREWLDGTGEHALSDWDISRDAPYFGIPIPDAPGKYFYVWLDAPIGYLAALKSYFDSGKARAKGERRSFEEFLAAPRDRADPLHRQGHHLLPHAVLAGDAQVRRQPVQGARPRVRARLHQPLRARRCPSRAAPA